MFSQGADVVEVSGSGQTFVDHCMRNLEDDGGCMAGGMLECVCLHVYLCVCVSVQADAFFVRETQAER